MNSHRHHNYLLFASEILLVFLAAGLFTLLNIQQVSAYSDKCDRHGFPSNSSCKNTGMTCSCNCGMPTNTSTHLVPGTEPTNCQALDSYSGYGIDNQGAVSGDPGCTVTKPYNYTVSFCPNNVGFKASKGGILYMYTGFTNYIVTVNGKTVTAQKAAGFSKINTGITVNAGDWIVPRFGYGESGTYDAFAWRSYDDSSVKKVDFTTARNDAAASGYDIISEQLWGDADTVSVYDTMDFNDGAVVFAVQNPAPDCNANTINLDVKPVDSGSLYLSERGNFVISASNPTMFKFVKNTFSPAIHLAPGACNPATVGNNNCVIDNRITTNSGFDTNVSWTLDYQNCNGAFCSVDICHKNFNFTIHPYPGFMETQGGTAFLGKNLNQLKFPSGHYFATGIFSSYLSFSSHFPSDRLGKNFNLLPYHDSNNETDFFNRYSGSILTSTLIERHQLPGGSLFDTDMIKNLSADKNKVHVFDVNGDITVGNTANNDKVYCNNSVIFLVRGNATFNKPIEYKAGEDSACLFIVRDAVTVNQYKNPDNLWAFIIAHSFNTTNNFAKLNITGGVVLQGAAATQGTLFDRNINNNVVAAAVVNSNKTTPSISMQYEGARYVKHFGSILRNPFEISIREITYTKAQ